MTHTVRTILALLLPLLWACAVVRAGDAGVTVSADSITTTDRLVVEVRFTVARGTALAPWTASAGGVLRDAGWTVVSVDKAAPALSADDPDTIVHAATFVLEPFLAGEYALPPITAQTAGSADSEPRTLATEARTIAVASVLPEGEAVPLPLPIPTTEPADEDASDTGSDAALGTLRPVPDEPADRVPVVLLVGAGIAAGVVVVAGVWVVTRAVRVRLAREPDPVCALERLARAISDGVPDEAQLAEIDRHVRTIAGGGRGDADPAFAPLLARIERARYAQGTGSAGVGIAGDAARLARRLAELGGRSASEASPADGTEPDGTVGARA